MALSTASSPPAGLHLFCGGFNYRQLAPALPDFHVCSTFYASNVYLNDCRNAANVLLGTLKSVPFAYTAANLPPPADSGKSAHVLLGSFNLRPTFFAGGCRMAIEVGGPYLPPTMEIPSEADIADMARWLISHCVVASNGIGGFVTKNFNQMMGYSVKQGLTVIPPFRKRAICYRSWNILANSRLFDL